MKKTLLQLTVLATLLLPTAAFAVVLSGNVKFVGSLAITGALSKSSGTFVIDDPEYPATKLLYHSFVESPDAKNIYDGIVILGSNGEATVELPSYFDALNGDVRYQFFAMDTAMPNLFIKIREANNRFTIAGGVSGGRVSWQITGIRHDRFITLHPIIPEVEKGPGEPVQKGDCIFEPLCQ